MEPLFRQWAGRRQLAGNIRSLLWYFDGFASIGIGLFGDLVLVFSIKFESDFALLFSIFFEFVEFGKVIKRSCFFDGSLSVFFPLNNQSIDGFSSSFFNLFPECNFAISEISFIIVFKKLLSITVIKGMHGFFRKLIKRKTGRALVLRVERRSIPRLKRRIPLVDDLQLIAQLLLLIGWMLILVTARVILLGGGR